MSNSKTTRKLLAFQYARQHRFIPSIRVVSRRTAKNMATGSGMILKTSRVIPQVGLERVFKSYA